MNWATLIVAIAAAVIAGLSAVVAFLAYGQSDKANRISQEANRLAGEASKQAAVFFEESGPKLDVKLSAQSTSSAAGVENSLLIHVVNGGRLEAEVQDVRLEMMSEGTGQTRMLSGYDLWPDLPFSLAPTSPAEVTVPGHKLATLSDIYGSSVSWRASAVRGDGVVSHSELVSIRHPTEPRLQDALASFNQRLNEIQRRLRNAHPNRVEEIERTKAALPILTTDLHALQARFKAAQQLGQHQQSDMPTMMANAEIGLKELRGLVASGSIT
jgi:hypothetical protein